MNKWLQFLGLASRAGCIVTGEDQIIKEIRSKKSNQSDKLVVVAIDAAEQTKKKYKDKCSYYKVDVIEKGTISELSHAIGKDNRAAICITDAGFKKGMLERI